MVNCREERPDVVGDIFWSRNTDISSSLFVKRGSKRGCRSSGSRTASNPQTMSTLPCIMLHLYLRYLRLMPIRYSVDPSVSMYTPHKPWLLAVIISNVPPTSSYSLGPGSSALKTSTVSSVYTIRSLLLEASSLRKLNLCIYMSSQCMIVGIQWYVGMPFSRVYRS